MERRTLLQAAGASGLTLFAGCTASGPGNDATDTPTASPSPTPSPTSTPGVGSVAATSFTVTKNECGTGQNTADGQLEGTTLSIDGVIDGADTCHSAKLDSARIEGGQLVVAVTTYVPPENEDAMCGECIVDIAYESTVEFDGHPPETAAVRHDGERVAELSLSE